MSAFPKIRCSKTTSLCFCIEFKKILSQSSLIKEVSEKLDSMEAHSGQNYLINVMLCLSNFKVFVVIFTLCAF